ncbi:sigma-70 family RNA polymerase sigma factor [Streptomyces sp. adm13(2018)]|uniref:RNA polymerase sigma factor n=1 Tax=unclassified Streptomyces TaxID=2593676 RepID=UPI0011CD6FDD|nr:sigma-70 family RNA polymerase sigma factor [Streptomyces sp. adm13(2018)]TXS10978.1 sigma-70 family RNA polymerase sigma factor [Streptomyces sp. adm13(2018)]
MTGTDGVEDLLRTYAPQVLGVLVRRYGTFDTCEDAVQEALIAAARQWPEEGVPDNPRGWLVTVAARRLVDQVRSEAARRRREDSLALATPASELLAHAADEEPDTDRDDSLSLLFLCCHPELSPPSRVALTLRAVGGLTTGQIAAAFLVPESTMAQRISRAKQTIREAGGSPALPPGEDRTARLAEVRHVLYLIFNEGYTASGGERLTAPELSTEAIRLARLLHRLLPGDTETAGLLALMLLTDARRTARTGPHGELVPLAEQDRGRWDAALVAEGVELISRTLPRGLIGPYQLQAAIAAVHDEAATAGDTDWPQILALYELLERTGPNPMVTLNRAVAVAMVEGPAAGLGVLDELARDKRLARHHRLLATRAHLLELLGERGPAAEAYREAARRTTSAPERRHLTERARRLG